MQEPVVSESEMLGMLRAFRRRRRCCISIPRRIDIRKLLCSRINQKTTFVVLTILFVVLRRQRLLLSGRSYGNLAGLLVRINRHLLRFFQRRSSYIHDLETNLDLCAQKHGQKVIDQ